MAEEIPITEFMTWTEADIARLPPLPHPQNPLDLEPEKEVEFRIQDWKAYRFTIRPRFPFAPVTKDVLAIRLFLFPGYSWRGLGYADATASKLVAALGAFLQRPDYREWIVKIKKVGLPPKAEFSLSIRKAT
jgi:hypothetical protein